MVVVYLGTRYAPPEVVVPPTPTYKISGYVKTDGIALSDVAVTLDGKSTFTNLNGYYEFTGLAGNASYTLTVSKAGYESYEGGVQLGTENKVVPDITLKAISIVLPETEIRGVLATRENVPADNVEIYFCVPAEDVENENFAAGAVVSNQKSIVFIYNKTTDGITTIENEYTATTSDALQGMSIIALKDVTSPFAQDYLGRTHINKIVPSSIVKTDNTYTFNYYDGYNIYFNQWGHGTAIIDENMEVELISHVWG